MYFLFAYPTLNGSFFQKKKHLIQNYLCEKEGDVWSQFSGGDIATKISSLASDFFWKSFCCITQWWEVFSTAKDTPLIIRQLVDTAAIIEKYWPQSLSSSDSISKCSEWLRNFHRSKYIEVSRLKKRKIRSWKKEMNRSWKPLLVGGFNHLKNMLVKMGIFPKQGWKQKIFETTT